MTQLPVKTTDIVQWKAVMQHVVVHLHSLEGIVRRVSMMNNQYIYIYIYIYIKLNVFTSDISPYFIHICTFQLFVIHTVTVEELVS